MTDSGKLPSYKYSYLFRFHPYARVKPSARERTMAVLYTDDNSHLYDKQGFIPSHQTAAPGSDLSSTMARNPNDTVNVTHSNDAPRRKLSMSTLMVDLALLACRKPSSAA
ncbi:hypothetical protein EDC04DRAFT_2889109 [Pisolithus marmoratus]|nr:hypothetical protein EDC04DRAFT_2889109 [Pisolithus marmoratus]